MRPLAVAVTLALLPLAGCIGAAAEPEEKTYTGAARGYTPTASHLKVDILGADGTWTLFGFDRRDWHTAELARRIDVREVRELTVEGRARMTLGEILVLDVTDPAGLSGLRYDKMDASPQARQRMDAEHDELLKRVEASIEGDTGTIAGLPPTPAGLPYPK